MSNLIDEKMAGKTPQNATAQKTNQKCDSCRHHSKRTQPKVVSESYDTLVEFADEDETVYSCRAAKGPYAGREVGATPVNCENYEPGIRLSLAEVDALDKMMSRFTKITK